MVEVAIENAVVEDEARQLLKDLKVQRKCIIPSPKNVNRAKSSPEIVNKITEVVGRMSFDLPNIAGEAIAQGFTFENIKEQGKNEQ